MAISFVSLVSYISLQIRNNLKSTKKISKLQNLTEDLFSEVNT